MYFSACFERRLTLLLNPNAALFYEVIVIR